MSQIEVFFLDKIGPYQNGQIAFFDENNKFLRAILKGKKAVVLNPPDWELDKVTNTPVEAPILPVIVKVTKEELDSIKYVDIKVEEVSDGKSESDSKPEADPASSSEDSTGSRRHGKKSPERSPENEAASSEGYGGSSSVVEGGEEASGGEDGN